MRGHNLTYLYTELMKRNFFALFRRHKLSMDKGCLVLVYLDYLLDEQFITVIRTSPLAYRIYYDNKLVRTRTVKETADKLDTIHDEIMARSKLYSVMTIAELKHYNKNDYEKKAELYKRYNSQNRNGV